MLVTATALAQKLRVTKGRVSQYVAEGRLDGCYTGEGRARRFDLEKVAAALNRSLDPAQMLGNGASTRRALRELRSGAAETVRAGDAEAPEPASAAPSPRRESSDLFPTDPDRYELARIQKTEEEARRLRRQNEEAEGTYVLASEVARQTARLVGQEVAEFETVLREAARKVADRHGIEARAVRQILVETWRAHRAARSEAAARQAGAARMAEAEMEADI